MATNLLMARGKFVGGKEQINSTKPGGTVGLGAKARRVMLGVGLLGAPLVLGLAGPATAQDSDNSSSEVCARTSFDGFTLLNPETPRTPVADIQLPAGVVTITSAHSWDAYPNRVNVVQLSEIWEVEFIAADGSVVGVSAPTGDVEDNIAEGHWYGSLGDTTLTAPAVGLRAHHRPDMYDEASKNSVHAGDITVCWQVQTPTTQPPATQPPTTEPTTTVPGDVCPVDGDGNPIDSDNPNCPAPVTTTVQPITTTAPPPSGPTTVPACPLDGDGNPVDPDDPDCPQPTTTTAAPTTTAPPPQGPTLPVTGSESTLLLLSGLWMLGAGSTMVAYSRTR